ncbi:unnamed protein product, partial [Acanthocheilonema viteae]
AYQTFLKNVISGLHTVHSKLKRLQTRLVICNVEQIRALRGLGAIQQGVNRCKLISCNDFDQLYDDCYRMHRAGRPTKRSIEFENTPTDRNKKAKYTSDRTLVPFTISQQIDVRDLMEGASESLRSAKQTIDITIPHYNFSESSSALIIPRSASLSSLPLNLTKNANNHQYDNVGNASQKEISYDNSKMYQSNQNVCSVQDASTEYMEVLQAMLSKLITLIEIATLNLKTERELVENEKCEV